MGHPDTPTIEEYLEEALPEEERLDLTDGRYLWGKDADMKQSPEGRRQSGLPI